MLAGTKLIRETQRNNGQEIKESFLKMYELD